MQSTNRTLYQYFQEYNNLQPTLLCQLIKSKLRQFANDNGIRYNTLNKQIFDLTFKYYSHDEDKNSPFGYKLVIEDDKPVLREGFEEEQYNAEMEALMSQEVSIKF